MPKVQLLIETEGNAIITRASFLVEPTCATCITFCLLSVVCPDWTENHRKSFISQKILQLGGWNLTTILAHFTKIRTALYKNFFLSAWDFLLKYRLQQCLSWRIWELNIYCLSGSDYTPKYLLGAPWKKYWLHSKNILSESTYGIDQKSAWIIIYI